VPDSIEGLHARYHAMVLPHLDRLLGFARRRTEAAAAEDAVQEACIRAWVGFAELRDASKVRPWLYRILRTVLSEAREKDDRRQQLVSITRLERAHEALVADESSPFAEVAARIDGEVIRAALASIPDEFATPVELHDIDGFKYQEIADIVGVPIGTVMSRIWRGRRLLAGAVASNRRAWALGTDQAEAGRRPHRAHGQGTS
jgi:RNA polymerase sigma-70 factor (ECF subfamily)